MTEAQIGSSPRRPGATSPPAAGSPAENTRSSAPTCTNDRGELAPPSASGLFARTGGTEAHLRHRHSSTPTGTPSVTRESSTAAPTT